MVTIVTSMSRCLCGPRLVKSSVSLVPVVMVQRHLVDHQWPPTIVQHESEESTSSHADRPKAKVQQPLHVFKRMNWESLKQFGPLLRQHPKMNVESPPRKPVAAAAATTTMTTTVVTKESGFKHLDMRQPSNNTANLPYSGTVKPKGRLKPKDVPLDVQLLRHPLSGVYRDQDSTSIDMSFRVLPPTTDSISWPTVTRILQATMSAESLAVLDAWKNRMIAKLGEEGFERFQQEMFQVGRRFHKRIEDYLLRSGTLETLYPDANEEDRLVAAHWTSLSSVLKSVGDVALLETRVQHPRLCYTGVIDCVAKYRGTVVLIEWKTAQRPKTTIEATYDNPLQAVAYLGALRASRCFDGKVDGVLIVVASADGHPAHTHYLNEERCVQYWALWLQRLFKYNAIQEAKTASAASNQGLIII